MYYCLSFILQDRKLSNMITWYSTNFQFERWRLATFAQIWVNQVKICQKNVYNFAVLCRHVTRYRSCSVKLRQIIHVNTRIRKALYTGTFTCAVQFSSVQFSFNLNILVNHATNLQCVKLQQQTKQQHRIIATKKETLFTHLTNKVPHLYKEWKTKERNN